MIDALRQWAFTLVLTAMIGSIATVVSNSPNIKKYIKFTCGLVALAVMIAPISSLFSGLPDIFRAGAVNEQPNRSEFHSEHHEADLHQELRYLIADKSEQLLRQRISAMIEQKIGIKPTDIYIYSNVSNPTEAEAHLVIEKIVINMPAEAVGIETSDIEDIEEIREHLRQISGGDVVIEITEQE